MKDAFKGWRAFLSEGDISRIGKINTHWTMEDAITLPEGSDVDAMGGVMAVAGADEDKMEEDCADDVEAIATKAHSGQTRRSGEPYITHPQATASLAKKFGYEQVIIDAAYLHDTLEDAASPAEVEKMIQSACPEALPLVKQLTHSKDTMYGDYVLSLQPQALAVKLLDMHHNSMDLDPDSKQYQKYAAALKKLQSRHGGVPAGVSPAHWAEISAKFELDHSMGAITERWRVFEGVATKEKIHQLADKLNIPWDDDPEFKNWTKSLTGKSHLDDMSKDELSNVYSALKKKEAEQTNEL